MGGQTKLVQAAHRTGVEYSSSELEQLAGGIGDAVITLDTEGDTAANTIRATVQLKDKNDSDLVAPTVVRAYLADNGKGSSLADTAPTGGVGIGTKGEIFLEDVTNKLLTVVSDVFGVFDLDIVDTGTPTFWLVVILSDGRLVVSAAITFV